MEKPKEIPQEYEKRNQMLESDHEQLRDKLLEQDKLRKVYIEDLNNMKTSLGHLQDALMKSRANILSHEMANQLNAPENGPMRELETGNDSTTDVVLLQAQLAICKSDLAEQRAAYQELLIEKNRITSELQSLLQKNHQLSMDHAQHRGNLLGHQQILGTERAKLYGTSPGRFERQIEPCPHCNNMFGDFLTLETHIKDCPGLDY